MSVKSRGARFSIEFLGHFPGMVDLEKALQDLYPECEVEVYKARIITDPFVVIGEDDEE